MNTIPYVEYTQLEKSADEHSQWYHMTHLSNACASMDSHRTSAYAICLLRKGTIQLESDLFIHKTEAPAIFTIAPSSIRKFSDADLAYDAEILFFRKEVFLEGLSDINCLDKFDFFEKAGHQVVALSEEQFQQFETYFDLVRKKSFENTPNASTIVRNFIYIILNEIDDVHQSQKTDKTQDAELHSHILSQFKSLLSDHFIEERQVAFYADKLHLTPKYFSTVIKKVSGKTAGTWINEMLLLESKVRLQNKQLSIAQIANDLNFSDPSHFGKFFRKHTGISPLEYRK